MRIEKKLFKKGNEAGFRFVIGIFLGAFVFVAFASCAFKILKGEDEAEKTFNAMADRINALADRMEETSATAFRDNSAQLIRIDPGEPWLFFDKGTSYIVAAYTDIELDDFLKTNYDILGISDNPAKMDYFLDRAKNVERSLGRMRNGGVFLYSKPLECGDSACMVICESPRLTIKSFPDQEKSLTVDISEQYQKFTIQSNLIGVIKCNSMKVRTFDNIEKFYRKPFFAQTPGVSDQFMTMIAPNFGFMLETSFPFTSGIKIKKDELENEIEPYPSEKSTLEIYEYGDGSSNTENKFLLSSDVIYPVAFKKGIVMCYQPPCLTPYEQFYSVWQDMMNSCLKHKNCGGLKTKIDDLKIDDSTPLKVKQTLTLSMPNVEQGKPPVMKLTITGIENSILISKTYMLDADVELFTDWYGEEFNAKDKEISFYKNECKQAGMFRENPTVPVLKIGTEELQFKSISVVKPVTTADKLRLVFEVEDLHADCKSGVV